MQIREATQADLPHVLAVVRRAFGGEEEVVLVRELLDDPTAQPVVSLLAAEEDRPLGHVLFTAARVEGRSPEVTAAILAPLAVVPEAQGRGIGGALIERGLEVGAGRWVELVFVLGHPGYYPRHGFRPAGRLGFSAPFPISPEVEGAWMVRALRCGLLGSVEGTVVCAAAMDRPEYWRE